MFQHGRPSIFPIVFILVALALTLMFCCCDSPTAPGPATDNGLAGTGAIDPGTSGAFLLGEVSDTSIMGPGTLEVWAMNVAFDDSTGMATFDVQLLNRTRRTIAPPIRFVVTDIRPNDVAAVDFDGVSRDGFPFYDFSASLGGDGVLEPGERTARVGMKFHTVTARSFAIGFRIDIGPPAGTGTIAGVVFFDGDMDGEMNRACRCEPGVPGITVALEKKLDDGDMVTLITRTDSSGQYRFAGLREGVHKVLVVAPEDRLVTSPNPLLVTLIMGADEKVQDFLGANFGLYPRIPPNPPPTPAVLLFGPIVTGVFSPWGTEIDSAFVDPPSPLTVVYKYYLEVENPPFSMPGVIDSAQAWINNGLVLTFRPAPPDSTWRPDSYERRIVQIPDSLVKIGERNTIRLSMKGDEWAVLNWRVYKKP